MTTDEIIDGVLRREGGWRDEVPRLHAPPDPATNRGITFLVFKRYHEVYLGWPKDTIAIADLRNLTDDLARQIYTAVFVEEPGFIRANIPFEPLRVQLIDFGVNSSPARAVRWLQRVLRLPVTGALDDETIGLLRSLVAAASLNWDLTPLMLVNDALVAARSYMIDQAVDQGTMRKADEEGVESRALSFFLARP